MELSENTHKRADKYYQKLLKQTKNPVFTGERVVPCFEDRYLLGEHLSRYALAAQYVNNNIVLDAGCGDGYGSSFLAEKAKSVLAVDIDDTSISLARIKYKGNNIQYVAKDLYLLREIVNDAKYDVITAFEILEHLDDPKQFLSVIKSMLAPRGVAIISTPNAIVHSPDRQVKNKFHKFELLYREYEDMLGYYFPNIEIYGQNHNGNYMNEAAKKVKDTLVKCLLSMDVLKMRNLVKKEKRQNILNSTGLQTPRLAVKALPSEFTFTMDKVTEAPFFVAICKV